MIYWKGIWPEPSALAPPVLGGSGVWPQRALCPAQDPFHPGGPRPLDACGILLVYDITNRWSFDGIDRWIKEIDEHAPGVPRILVGNRLHLAFKRQVPTEQARAYAEKNGMTFFEVSPLCNFNVIESFTELSRIVLMRHGMEKIWRPNRGKGLPRAVGEKTETDWGSGRPLRGRRPGLQGRPALLHCFPGPLAAELAKLALCGVLVFQEGTVQDILSAPQCWEAVLWTLPQSGKGAASKPVLLELTHKGPGLFSLQDLCCRAIVSCTPVHLIDKLPLPVTIKSHLKSFSMANGMNAVMMHGRSYSLASGAGGSSNKGNSLKRSKSIRPPQSPPQNCSRSNCKIS
ncbi:hypothetical protein GH733_012207 [Mirounga leonina]|nr:hypothetical protein GH733_012207 [Mirounga leonina]